jgi:hypothetical protein
MSQRPANGKLPLAPHWRRIRETVDAAQLAAVHCALATVDPEGEPHVTPIGTVFLRDDHSGYFFDTYTSALGRHIDANGRICVMAVNTAPWFWLRSLLFGRFPSPPGLRLHGRAGALREATTQEIEAVTARTRRTRRFKGHQLLWTSFTHVRDLHFTSFTPVLYPVMMDGMWATPDTASGVPLEAVRRSADST